jgi:Zn finger protein HypA/HybF involved in hydrogenase expression
MKRAQAEIENQFKNRGCASCHNVNDTHAADLPDRFQIAPVRLTRDYFPDVHFSHRLHAVQKDKSGDTACLSCHAVRQSKSSADVFVPDLPKCLDCHSERLTADRVTLQCSSCHSYHPTTIIARSRETEVQ